MRIGCIGLGHLGTAIANRLIDCGHDLDPEPDRGQGVSAAGHGRGQPGGGAAAAADLRIVCLFDSKPPCTRALSGDQGLLTADLRGNSSSITPPTTSARCLSCTTCAPGPGPPT